jgi:dTDP-4-dehydrorhamnose reductase
MGEITNHNVRVLVTGGNGQLGSELKAIESKFPNINFTFTDIDDLDITKADLVNSYFEKNRPNFIINCAAYTAVDKAESDQQLAFSINAEAPKVLSEAARTFNSKIIHISTDYVFDGRAFEPYTEIYETSPNSVYGKSKLIGELYVLESGVGMVIRTSWLYSIYGKNFVKTIAQKAITSNSLSVVYNQVGSPTWAFDLANAIMVIVEKGEQLFTPEIFHYSNEGVCSWYDFAKEIVNFYGYNCKIIPILTSEYPTAANRPPYSVLNKSKIKASFGLEIPHWRESLNNCLTYL